MSDRKITELIDELEGKIGANNQLRDNIVLLEPKNFMFKKIVGTFVTIFLSVSFIFPIMALFFTETFTTNFIILFVIITLFTFIVNQNNNFIIFGYLRESLGIENYINLLTAKSAIEYQIKLDTTTLGILRESL